MKTLYTSLLLMAAIGLQAQPVKRYEFKSIIITYAFESSGMGSRTTGTKTLKIDDFGAKEAKEEISTFTMTAMGNTTTEDKHTLDLLNGDFGYSINLLTHEGTKMNVAEIARAFQPAGMAMAGDLEKYRGQEGMKRFVEENGGTWHGNESFLNKNCWVFDMMGVKMWMYKGVILKSESTAWGMDITETALTVQENVSIPENAFEVPSGITITEQQAMGGLGSLFGEMEPGDDPAIGPPPGLNYEKFKTATSNLNIPGYQLFLTDNSDNIYLTTYVKSETDQVVIMMENEPRFYEMAEGGEGMVVENTYSFNGHDAVYLHITNEDDGTPVNSRALLYHMPEYQSVLYIITGIPMSQQKLEQIIKQIQL
ncbi:MAG: hypothetical protein M9948_13120 [Lentimicrobium sp.]|nr:hypothetical protein [Lentimicrobium sp.]